MTIGPVREYVAKLADEFRPERVILFGSMAEGRATPDSDVDLMVVMNGTRNSADRALEIRRRLLPAFDRAEAEDTDGDSHNTNNSKNDTAFRIHFAPPYSAFVLRAV